jgi:transcriptional regulator with XRE-family HTH domain
MSEGERLRALRKELGWTQTDLAAWLGERLGRTVRQSTISQWETGLRRIPWAVLLFEAMERRSDQPTNPSTEPLGVNQP